jgi:cell division septal protein FtsQ
MAQGRFILFARFTVFGIFLAASGWAAYFVVRYLTTSPSFELRKLSVSGIKRVEENQVLAKAGFELGTNAFKVDLQKIRQRVEEIRWVRHALVERVLPDQIIIKVVEREPIGLARIRGEVYEFDRDATILEPDPAGGASFPVLDGLRPNDPRGNKKKVEIYRKVLEDIGQPSLSEVHINSSGEVSVVAASDPLVINLGASELRSRWTKYLQFKAEIDERYPQAVRVDLRFKNQVIIQMKEDDTGESIIWDAEKKTL